MKIDITKEEWLRLLNRLNIVVEKVSGDKVFCLCPFHEDTTASFVVYLDSNYFKCYSIYCGKKGDIIDLVSHIVFKAEKGHFYESINWLREIVSDSKLKSYVKSKEKDGNFKEIFCSWFDSNTKIEASDCKFLKKYSKKVLNIVTVKNSSWSIINNYIKFFDYAEKIYKEDLILVEFDSLGYFVYNRTGSLVGRITNKFFRYSIFEKFNGSYTISGKDFNKKLDSNSERIVSAVLFTEDPLIYFSLLKNNYKCTFGTVDLTSILNFPEKFFVYCFIVLNDKNTSIKLRFEELFKFHMDEKSPWFYKIFNSNKDVLLENLKTQLTFLKERN